MVGTNFFEQIHEGLSCMGGLMIGSYQRGRESFSNAFSRNLSNVNPKISPISVSLILIIHILFEKLTPRIRSWIWKATSVHYVKEVRDFMQRCLLVCRGSSIEFGLGSKWRSLLEGTGSTWKLCMLPCHSCQNYEAWRSQEVGEGFKVIICGAKHKGVTNFYGGSWPL